MFDTTKEDLKDILRQVDKGSLQLPDFQRDYVWGDEDVRSLIASIAKGFPVGALLTLGTGGAVHFKPRLLAGVAPKQVAPSELLLDGQQRITSLYQSMMAKEPVRTRTPRGATVERYYYLDIERAIDGHTSFDEAIVGVPADRVVRADFGRTIVLDVSTQEAEFANDLFPLNRVFECHKWLYPWRDYWRVRDRDRDVAAIEEVFFNEVLERIDDYKMPIIKLDKENSRESICLVFEKVNVGGKKLDAFELVTAIYAADEFDLREDWNGSAEKLGRRQRMVGSPNRRDVLSQVASTDFLQACTLLHTREVRLARVSEGFKDKEVPQVSCRRDAVLGLPLHAYRKYSDPVEAGFVEAAELLNELKIIWHRDIPYPPQLVALASVFAVLGKEARNARAKQQLKQWFWSVAMGELYGSTTESRLARDVPELADWLRGDGPPPRSIDEALFQRERLHSLRSRTSAAYKGIHALLMKKECRDFISGKPVDLMTFFSHQIDIHHIFPQAWCKNQGIAPAVFNSVVNKTALSRATNIAIGGDAPHVYLKRIQERYDFADAEMDEILSTHFIDPALLRNDDFEAFFEARSRALATIVAEAMGKPVVDETGSNEPELMLLEPEAWDEDEAAELTA